MKNNNSQLSRGLSVLIVLFISLIVSFLVSYFSYFYVFPEIEKKYLYTRTPDVKKMPISDAIELLNRYSLKYDIIGEEEIDNLPSGYVVFQQPLPKSLIKKNSIVSLVISKESPLIKVPDLKSKTVEEAKKILPQVYKLIDKAAKVGVIKKNTAARKKSKIAKLIFQISATRSSNPV